MEDLQPIYNHIFNGDEFHLHFFTSFDEFSRAYASEKSHPDLIIADIMLEDGHFFKLLNESDMTLNTPYLVISSSDDLETIRSAYQAGAIDYLLKPFNQNEIRAKVERHLINIEERIQETSKSLEALNLDLTQFTNKEIKIVIWKNIAIHPNTLDVHIYNLRKKLKPFGYGIKAIGNGLFKFIDIKIKDKPDVAKQQTNIETV